MKRKTRSIVCGWMPVLIWMVVIALGSTDLMSTHHTSRFLVPFLRWLNSEMALETIALVQFGLRKMAHLSEYALLAILLWRAVRMTSQTLALGWCVLLVLLGSATYASADEFHQSFLATRTGAVGDVLIDCCGAGLGVLIGWFFARRGRSGLKPGL